MCDSNNDDKEFMTEQEIEQLDDSVENDDNLADESVVSDEKLDQLNDHQIQKD